MPFYVYKCKEGHETEKRLPIEEPKPDIVRCDFCDRAARRVFVPSPVHLKGSGWGSKP